VLDFNAYYTIIQVLFYQFKKIKCNESILDQTNFSSALDLDPQNWNENEKKTLICGTDNNLTL